MPPKNPDFYLNLTPIRGFGDLVQLQSTAADAMCGLRFGDPSCCSAVARLSDGCGIIRVQG